MNTKIALKQPIRLENPELLSKAMGVLEVSTMRIYGIQSVAVEIKFGLNTPDPDPEKECYVSCKLNRNQARYMIKALEAYIEEEDIDVENED